MSIEKVDYTDTAALARIAKKADFYGLQYDEEYHSTTLEDAITDFDGWTLPSNSATDVVFAAVKRMDAAGVWPVDLLLEVMKERWEEEHGSPDGDFCPDVTLELTDACKALIVAFDKVHTKSWSCETIAEITVDVEQWKKKEGAG